MTRINAWDEKMTAIIEYSVILSKAKNLVKITIEEMKPIIPDETSYKKNGLFFLCSTRNEPS